MMTRLVFFLFLSGILFLSHLGGGSGCGGSPEAGDPPDDGVLDCGELTVAAAVRDLQATDGTFTNKVALSWEAPFVIETVDDDGSVGSHSSATFDSDWTLHVVYHEVLPLGAGRLKHAWRTTSECWQTEVVDEATGGDVGTYTSLDIDISGGNILHISYYDQANNQIKHAWGTTGSWQTGVVDTAVVNSLQSTGLTFNSSDDTLHVVYKGISGLVHASKSSSSIGAWQTETVVAGWTGQEVAIVDTSNTLHIMYSTPTTADGGGLSYATNSSGSWQTELVDPGLVGGHLAADLPGTTWGGATLLVSYNDFGDTGVDDQLKFAWMDGDGVWTTEVVDSDGSVGWDTSIVGTGGPTGTVYISYYDVTNANLKVASKILTAENWTIQTLDEAGTTGTFTSLALDASDQPHITYHDSTAGSLNRAYVGEEIAYDVGRRLSGETGDFTIITRVTETSYDDTSVTQDVVYEYQLVPILESLTGGAVTDSGYAAAATIVDQGNDVGTYSSIAVGGDGAVHIAYHDDTDNDLKYAVKASDSSSWSTEIVDGNIPGGDSNVGEHTSVAVAGDGTVHITYFSQTDLKLKHASSSEGGWSLETIEDSTGHVGTYNDLAIDDDGTLHVSYYLAGTDSDLKYARKTSGGAWTTSVIDATGAVGRFSSIAVESGSDPNVHIAYYDDTNGDLKYAEGTWDGAAYTWATETVDSTGDVGEYASIVTGGDNRIHISYFDDTNDDLKHAWKGLSASSWEIDFAAEGSGANFVGQYTSVVVGEEGTVFIAHHGEVPDRLELTTVAVDGAAYAVGSSQTLDSPSVGDYASMALGPDGTLHFSYYDTVNNALKYTAASP